MSLQTTTVSATPSSVDGDLAAVWVDRDLSWIEFNRRVLAEALDDRTPLLERVKFLAIFTSNLDEFFMKRIAVLRENITPERQRLIGEIRQRLLPMLQQQEEFFHGRLVPELSRHGIHLRRWHELSAAQQREAGEYFDAQVSAALTPLVIHPAQPFPFFSNLSLSVAFFLHDDRSGESVDARVKVPRNLKQWVRVTTDVPRGQHVFVGLHELIRENAHKLYPGMRLTSPTLFRLTRDAEVEIEEDANQGLRELVREQIRQRRYEPAVRLEFAPGADARLRQMLQNRFALSADDVYDLPGDLDCTSLFQIAALNEPALRDAQWTPVVPARLDGDASIFDAIAAGDLLVHHPYESFDDSVERFISTAADDAATVAIKMTVYRVGDDTPFVRSLIRAAEAGKQVACVIELKARFDEERNLHWATELERAGAHVTVGDTTLKTHAKVALVVRREASGLRSYVHIGTGNYHVRTARLYTDVGLLTCDPTLTADVVNLFHHLTGRSDSPEFRKLLVAPTTMRQRFLDLIAGEADHQRAGRPARIIAKMNQLEDLGDDRGALRGVPGRSANRSRRARVLLPAPGCARMERDGAHSIGHRQIPRAFEDLPLRGRPREPAGRRVLHRVGRLDGAEPVDPRGSGHAGGRAQRARETVGDPRRAVEGPAAGVADGRRRPVHAASPQGVWRRSGKPRHAPGDDRAHTPSSGTGRLTTKFT